MPATLTTTLDEETATDHSAVIEMEPDKDAPAEGTLTQPAKPFIAARIDDLKRLWTNAGLIRAWSDHTWKERPQYIGASLLRGGLVILGFRNAVKAWMEHPPRKRSKHVWKGIAGMVADRLTGRVVVNTIKIGIIMAAAGAIGGSIVATALIFAAARGTGVAIYTYGKNYLQDRLKQKKTGEKARFFSLGRLGSSGLGFVGSALGGAAGGAALGWAVQTEAGRAVFAPLRHVFNTVGIHTDIGTRKGQTPDAQLVEGMLNNDASPPTATTTAVASRLTFKPSSR